MKRLTILFRYKLEFGFDSCRISLVVKESEIAQTIAHLNAKGFEVEEYNVENLSPKTNEYFFNACNEVMSYLLFGRDADKQAEEHYAELESAV